MNPNLNRGVLSFEPYCTERQRNAPLFIYTFIHIKYFSSLLLTPNETNTTSNGPNTSSVSWVWFISPKASSAEDWHVHHY